jgi:hypothetical protein
MSGVALAGVAYAEVHRGMWIVRCPAVYCWSAMAVTLGLPEFVCLGDGSCGEAAPIVWPRDPLAIATLLRMRPDPTTRNWLPGETLQDLVAENAAHGCLPAEWTALPGRTLVVHEVEGVAVAGLLADALPPAERRLAIASTGR